MVKKEPLRAWADILEIPVSGRCSKPRQKGLTMVIDKGLGLLETKDLLEVAANYIDFIKLGFGTSALYTNEFLVEKINLVKSYGVDIYPGGTFFEIAFLQGNFDAYLRKAAEYGFVTLEISDGTINITDEVRAKIVKRAVDFGFRVITEVGKKDPGDNLSSSQTACLANMDLDHGAYKVIMEGRESGKGIGIYDNSGTVKDGAVEDILKGIGNPDDIIWEAPLKDQQVTFINEFGCNVNLGNIQPNEVISLEALRVGLRADTLKQAFHTQKNKK